MDGPAASGVQRSRRSWRRRRPTRSASASATRVSSPPTPRRRRRGRGEMAARTGVAAAVAQRVASAACARVAPAAAPRTPTPGRPGAGRPTRACRGPPRGTPRRDQVVAAAPERLPGRVDDVVVAGALGRQDGERGPGAVGQREHSAQRPLSARPTGTGSGIGSVPLRHALGQHGHRLEQGERVPAERVDQAGGHLGDDVRRLRAHQRSGGVPRHRGTSSRWIPWSAARSLRRCDRRRAPGRRRPRVGALRTSGSPGTPGPTTARRRRAGPRGRLGRGREQLEERAGQLPSTTPRAVAAGSPPCRVELVHDVGQRGHEDRRGGAGDVALGLDRVDASRRAPAVGGHAGRPRRAARTCPPPRRRPGAGLGHGPRSASSRTPSRTASSASRPTSTLPSWTAGTGTPVGRAPTDDGRGRCGGSGPGGGDGHRPTSGGHSNGAAPWRRATPSEPARGRRLAGALGVSSGSGRPRTRSGPYGDTAVSVRRSDDGPQVGTCSRDRRRP